MRRKLILAALVLVTFLLQSTVFKALAIASVSPNLLLILTVSFGLMCGKRIGMFTGFLSGLMIDLFLWEPFRIQRADLSLGGVSERLPL